MIKPLLLTFAMALALVGVGAAATPHSAARNLNAAVVTAPGSHWLANIDEDRVMAERLKG